jgi:hypothetical protein
VKELAPFQTKEGATNSSCAGAVGALATFESSVHTDWKKKWQYAYRLLRMSSLKEGAM